MEISTRTLEIMSKWGEWYCKYHPSDTASERVLKDIRFMIEKEIVDEVET